MDIGKTLPPPEFNAFGNYEVVRELARGGQGIVYEGYHAQLDQRAAIKVLLDADPKNQQRFRQEAQVLARLEHPNLVKVLNYGDAEGRPYLALEFVVGRDLNALVQDDGIPACEWSTGVIAAVARALQYCHEHGIVHRDIKPANILIAAATDHPVLTDFGLLKRDKAAMGLTMDGASELTKAGATLGTPAYMAPEQTDSTLGTVGPLSDVYALGATLYFCLTGQAPFQGTAVYNVIMKLLRDPPPDPRDVNRAVPAGLAELCMRSMAKDPAERPASAEAFAERLMEGVAGEPGARRQSVRVRTGRSPWPVLTLLLVLSTAAGLVWIWRESVAMKNEEARRAAEQRAEAAEQRAEAAEQRAEEVERARADAEQRATAAEQGAEAAERDAEEAERRAKAAESAKTEAEQRAEAATKSLAEAEEAQETELARKAMYARKEAREAGFTFLREEAFVCGGQTQAVKIFRSELFAWALGLTAGETDVACEFVLVPGGTFTMGSPADEAERQAYEGPQHDARIKPFLVARTEVSQAVWQGLVGSNPAQFKGERRPVERVTWNSAVAFCKKAGLRLPSEAEWEYACRANSTTPFAFGRTITPDKVNCSRRHPHDPAAKGPQRKRTSAVGSLPANAFGLFDVHGNVWEWCQDAWQYNYNGAPVDGSAREDAAMSLRVIRGGGWNDLAGKCRSAFRGREEPRNHRGVLGLRPASSR